MKQPSLEQMFVHLGNELYQQRHIRKQKISSVCHDLGISTAVISRIENGRYNALTISLLKKLADYYEVPVPALFLINDENNAVQNDLVDYLQSEVMFLRESNRELLKINNKVTIIRDE